MLTTERGKEYTQIPEYNQKFKTQITDIKISYNEKIMAIALSSESDTNAAIKL